ncbi:hypothetical protein C8R44DRAFT_890071 [Mycena epipterygia]|nr:hypothetical protein C8R44DRAFT_890071 [Mycena epipterygia]
MPRTIEEIKNLCPRFRILVIGRRNAGKTTILKKMCDSDGSDVQIVNNYGDQVDLSILEPNRQRGMSDIENEITFRSNPLFIFHDSRGIEAGADLEKDSPLRIEYLWSFLRKRSMAKRLRDQIHAVWFCIPMDEQRAPSAQFELAFFNARESPVPIIAVCTKFESLIDAEISENDSDDAEEEARQAAQLKFQRTVLQALQGTNHPPEQIVQLQNLDEPTTGCATLTDKTYAVIRDETLSDLFALAQHNSLSVGCTKVLQAMTETSWTSRMRSDNSEAFETVFKQTKIYMPMWRNVSSILSGSGPISFRSLTRPCAMVRKRERRLCPHFRLLTRPCAVARICEHRLCPHLLLFADTPMRRGPQHHVSAAFVPTSFCRERHLCPRRLPFADTHVRRGPQLVVSAAFVPASFRRERRLCPHLLPFADTPVRRGLQDVSAAFVPTSFRRERRLCPHLLLFADTPVRCGPQDDVSAAFVPTSFRRERRLCPHLLSFADMPVRRGPQDDVSAAFVPTSFRRERRLCPHLLLFADTHVRRGPQDDVSAAFVPATFGRERRLCPHLLLFADTHVRRGPQDRVSAAFVPTSFPRERRLCPHLLPFADTPVRRGPQDNVSATSYFTQRDVLPPFLTSLFGESTGMITNISHYISIAIVICIIFGFTGQHSRTPADLVQPVLQLIRTNTSFAASITKSVADARSEFPHEVDRPKLVDRFVRIVMMHVDALNAAWEPME